MLGSIDQNLASIRDGFDQLHEVGLRVARDGAQGDLSGNLVEMMQIKVQVQANVTALRTAQDTLGSLFDAFA